jgi:hypothetical protein
LASNPAWYGCALLFGGMFIGHHEGDRKTKVRMVEAAVEILKNESENPNFSQFSQEAQHFYPYAKKEILIAYTEALHQEISNIEDYKSNEWMQLRNSIFQIYEYGKYEVLKENKIHLFEQFKKLLSKAS